MKNDKKSIDRILFLIGLIIFLYVALRAYLLSFTYDESWTYLCFVLRRFINYRQFVHGDTNNHLLNTWLMELCVKIFPVSEFILRLPNVLAYALYLIYSAKLVRNLSSGVLIIGAFVLLNINPFLLDFFGLARGYGLSFGLTMASLYFTYKFINKGGSYISAMIAVLFLTLATFAYFSMLNFLLILSGILIVINFIKAVKEKPLNSRFKRVLILRNSVVILLPLVALFYIIPVLNKLKGSGSMDFGGKDGFWSDSVMYLIECTLYQLPRSDIMITIVSTFVAMVLIASLIYILYHVIRKKTNRINTFFVFIMVSVLLCFVANYTQFKFMNIFYPQGRYALLYFILFALLIIFLFEQLYLQIGMKVAKVFMLIISCFVINFLYAFNFNHVHDWHNENDTKDMIDYFIKNKESLLEGKENLNIGVRFQFGVDANFYRVIHHLNWLNYMDTRTVLNPLNDYYYVNQEDTLLFKKIPNQVLKIYPESKTILLKNTTKWKHKVLCSLKNNFDDEKINTHVTLSHEQFYSGNYSSKLTNKISFTPLLMDTVDDEFLKYKLVKLTVKGMVYANSLNTDATIVVCHQRNSETLNYYSQSIQELLYKPKVWTPFYFTVIVPDDVRKGETIASYCWNIGHHDIYIDDLEMVITGCEKE